MRVVRESSQQKNSWVLQNCKCFGFLNLIPRQLVWVVSKFSFPIYLETSEILIIWFSVRILELTLYFTNTGSKCTRNTIKIALSKSCPNQKINRTLTPSQINWHIFSVEALSPRASEKYKLLMTKEGSQFSNSAKTKINLVFYVPLLNVPS